MPEFLENFLSSINWPTVLVFLVIFVPIIVLIFRFTTRITLNFLHSERIDHQATRSKMRGVEDELRALRRKNNEIARELRDSQSLESEELPERNDASDEDNAIPEMMHKVLPAELLQQGLPDEDVDEGEEAEPESVDPEPAAVGGTTEIERPQFATMVEPAEMLDENELILTGQHDFIPIIDHDWESAEEAAVNAKRGNGGAPPVQLSSTDRAIPIMNDSSDDHRILPDLGIDLGDSADEILRRADEAPDNEDQLADIEDVPAEASGEPLDAPTALDDEADQIAEALEEPEVVEGSDEYDDDDRVDAVDEDEEEFEYEDEDEDEDEDEEEYEFEDDDEIEDEIEEEQDGDTARLLRPSDGDAPSLTGEEKTVLLAISRNRLEEVSQSRILSNQRINVAKENLIDRDLIEEHDDELFVTDAGFDCLQMLEHQH